MGETYRYSLPKKAEGNVKKAESAAHAQAVADAKVEAAAAASWAEGAQDERRKCSTTAKAAKTARKKAEKDALLQGEPMKVEQVSLPRTRW